jgi:transcriptional regulator with XRE-family HTH domain
VAFFHSVRKPLTTEVGMGWKQELAEQIKNARESASLTQSELARRLKVSRQMVSRYETGQDVPAFEILASIARTLETGFQVQGLQLVAENPSQRLKSLPKQLRLDFEKAQQFRGAVISITPSEGQILITAKIPA